MRTLIIKDNYVINVILTNPDVPFEIPAGCRAVVDPTEVEEGFGAVGIGDWYEPSEGQCYRPVGHTPPDVPEELQS
jgi:hypothetical protein